MPDAEQDDEGSVGTDTVPSTIEYPEDPTVDLAILDDSSWRLLDKTSKLASNTSSCSYVVSLDGIISLTDTDTIPTTLSLSAKGPNNFRQKDNT